MAAAQGRRRQRDQVLHRREAGPGRAPHLHSDFWHDICNLHVTHEFLTSLLI